MKFKKTSYLLLVVLVMVILMAGCNSGPQKNEVLSKEDPDYEMEYPATNINGVVPWGAGGGTDTICRAAIPGAQKFLGVSIIMNNMGGASGSVGHKYVYDQKSDGYTLLFNSEIAAVYPVIGISELSYDDFEPLCIFAKVPGVIIVEKNSPYNTLEDLVEGAKNNPSKINMGISGVGGLPHMSSLVLKSITGVSFNMVPFDGDAPLITNLLSKQIDVTAVAVGSAEQYINNGDFKGLAVVSTERNNLFPEVPAIVETYPEAGGLLDNFGPFFGAYAKNGTPESILKKLKEAFDAGFKDPDFQELCEDLGYIPLGYAGDEAREFIEEWKSYNAWMLYDAGDAKEAPDKFNISRPTK